MINVLEQALTLIPKQNITYEKFLGQVSNEIGNMVNSYAAPITVQGSIQPADNDTLYKLGIANTGDMYICYVPANVLSAAQLQSNDRIIDEDGQVFNIFRSEKWSSYPGQNWNKIILRRAKKYDNQ